MQTPSIGITYLATGGMNWSEISKTVLSLRILLPPHPMSPALKGGSYRQVGVRDEGRGISATEAATGFSKNYTNHGGDCCFLTPITRRPRDRL